MHQYQPQYRPTRIKLVPTRSSLSYQVLGRGRDVVPVRRWERVVSAADLAEESNSILRVKRREATEHDVNHHADAPNVNLRPVPGPKSVPQSSARKSTPPPSQYKTGQYRKKHSTTETVPVDAGQTWVEHFGGHVARRAAHGAHKRVGGLALGEAKVGHFDLVVLAAALVVGHVEQ
eukprot:3837273-Rhodomonas_salina.1